MDVNCNAYTLDAHTPLEVSSCAQLEIDKSSRNTNQLSDMPRSSAPAQASNDQDAPNDKIIHQVYMRKKDVIYLIQIGHIFSTDKGLHYKHNTDQMEIC